MPFIHIEWMEGRTVDQKRELARRVTDALAEVANVPREKIHVIFNEMKAENYGVAGELIVDRK
jgi:4-oxalocrotonate tautomerase